MSVVPIVDIDDVLFVSVGDELEDQAVATLQQELAERVVATRARGVLIDISVLDVVDSYMARALHEIAAATALLSARTVVVGMRPEVAITLAELGLTLPGMLTALSVREGLAALR
ncbi:STAS domain-containing protein [Amycolatopsis pigmentata]|uniref:STAS domain-containing protein n=1 Tax=Amycolatopsis pigmentata TaxID=450801 RepID=A0ABW5G1R2_9PSEU